MIQRSTRPSRQLGQVVGVGVAKGELVLVPGLAARLTAGWAAQRDGRGVREDFVPGLLNEDGGLHVLRPVLGHEERNIGPVLHVDNRRRAPRSRAAYRQLRSERKGVCLMRNSK